MTRNILIALNASYRIQRAALCSLGAQLDLWLKATDEQRQLGTLAQQLGVPMLQLSRAAALLPTADHRAESEKRRAAALGCRLITRLDEHYPRPLLDHPLPPPVLYCRGELPTGPAVSIVGARRMDSYGKDAAQLFGSRLAKAGVTVVSGFAIGIDTVAHHAAVEAGGRTVAVLGCGADIDYPKGNAGLAEKISARGAVISEFPLGCEPRAWHFPIRNRVIAALSAGTLVVQAKLRSGSLITAHLAMELGREVYAVPGRIFDELSLGTNGLIADGAVPVNCVDDILEAFTIEHQAGLFTDDPEPTVVADAPLPAGIPGKLLQLIPRGEEGFTAEDLAARTGLTVNRVLGGLLELELAGRIERRPGPVYGR